MSKYPFKKEITFQTDTHTQTYTKEVTDTRTHTQTYTYLRTHTHTHTHTNTHTHNTHSHRYAYTHIHTYTHPYVKLAVSAGLCPGMLVVTQDCCLYKSDIHVCDRCVTHTHTDRGTRGRKGEMMYDTVC
jgi:hypothetical protein